MFHFLYNKCIIKNTTQRVPVVLCFLSIRKENTLVKVLIHDLGKEYDEILQKKCDEMISANGQYAPCQGCFECWTKHPAECRMKDSLHTVCRVIGKADELIIITENCYGTYSPAVKNVLDRSIGISTPMSTYRGKQMHHTLRYGRRDMLKVYAYGNINQQEKATFAYMVERNAVNYGYRNYEFLYADTIQGLEEMI